nr:hypothetical protein [Tanacetum cinerariifolium]
MWSDQEKKIQKIDRLARSLLIERLLNDIYSLIDSNKTAKDLWDDLARHMLGSEYVINDLKKCGYSKYNCGLNFKFLNNLQPEWKQYATTMRHNKNLMDINIDALYNILKQNQRDINDAMGLKKKTVVVTSNPLASIAEKMKVSKRKEKVVVYSDSKGSDADDFSELKKITTLLAKAFNQRKFYSKPTNNNLRTSSTSQSANKKQEFFKTDDKKLEKKDDEKKRDMSKVKCYNCKKEGHFEKHCKKVKVKDYEYYKTKMLLAKKDKDEQVLLAKDQAWMESSNSETSSSSADDKIFEVSYYLSESESESEYETLENYDNTTTYVDHNESAIDHNDSEGVDKLIRKFNKNIAKCLKRIEKANQQNKDFKNQNKDLQDKYDVLKNQATTFEMKNKEKIIIDLEDEVVSLLEKEKENLKTIESLKSNDVETCVQSSEKVFSETENQSENDCQEVKKECDQAENLKVIAPGMFKLSVSQSVSPISVTKTSCDSKNVENKTKRKRRRRKSSKQNDKQVNNDVSRTNSDFVHFLDLDTFISVRRPKQISVIWKKKRSSNTSNVDLSFVSHLKLNIDVKRYSRKDLLSCNNSHLGETSSAYDCNDAMNVSCNSRLCDSFDENNLFIFDDESVRISPVSKMSFRKKPRNSMNVRSKSNSNKSSPRTVHRWLPKLQHLAKPIAKWILRVEHQMVKISKTPNSLGPIFKWVPKVC